MSFDLICGLPGQTLADWSRNLDKALSLRPEHLSLYLLEVHEGTPLADQLKRNARPQPDDDLAAEMYRVMLERVCAAGYRHYEISNFCLPGLRVATQHKILDGRTLLMALAARPILLTALRAAGPTNGTRPLCRAN